jgi:tryptophan-rich sensory protein
MAPAMSLIAFLIVTAGAAFTGARYMPGEWYETLAKPSWTPPDWLFGPAWTVLYVMIAVAGWMVWRETGFGVVIVIWVAQLVFNAAWSWLMFGLHRIDMALIDAGLMLIAIVAFIVAAWPVNQTAAWLFVPYLAWVCFATALNFAILRLNGRVAST